MPEKKVFNLNTNKTNLAFGAQRDEFPKNYLTGRT